MGMIGNLLRVTKAQLSAYLLDSSLLLDNIYLEETEEGNPNLEDIDKSWNGIIFLLTGQNLDDSDHPLTRVLFSGQLIDESQDVGYGPAHYNTPEQVRELNDQISIISEHELTKRYDAKKMAELDIYPGIWDDAESLSYLLEYFKTIQKIYALAAEKDEAIITFIN